MFPRLSTLRAEPGLADGHVAWVGDVLIRMQTIKPGMTRESLLKVFTTEGDPSTGVQRTLVSRDCPYFKVDIEFKAVGRTDRDDQGRVTLREDPRDLIVKISRPYLAFSVMDHVADSGLIAVSGNRDLLQFLGRLVETEGRAPLLAESADEARPLVRSKQPTAAIVDHTLPDGSGVKLALEFLHTVPDMLVIILVASVLPPEEAAVCREQYFTVLQKPFLASELANSLKGTSKRAAT